MSCTGGRPANSRSGFVYVESLEPRLAHAAEFVAVLFAFMFVGMEGLMLVCFCGERARLESCCVAIMTLPIFLTDSP